MKKIVLISLVLLISSNICKAQLNAPVQADTLYIKSMQYNFKEIKPANWPFIYIIQNTCSFIIDGKEFHIEDSQDCGPQGIDYTLMDGNNKYSLVKMQKKDGFAIHFSNYILNCSPERNSNIIGLIATQPKFQGSSPNEFAKWVNQHLIYPETAKKNGIQGRVMIQYTIGKDGCVTNVSVIQGAETSLNKEAVRVVSSSPKWTPGKDEEGNPVSVTYTFPVVFQLR